jgi:CheY-like chemotaxis protein
MAKILIADDSRVHQHLVTGWLQDQGHEVVTALDAVQAFMMGAPHPARCYRSGYQYAGRFWY